MKQDPSLFVLLCMGSVCEKWSGVRFCLLNYTEEESVLMIACKVRINKEGGGAGKKSGVVCIFA